MFGVESAFDEAFERHAQGGKSVSGAEVGPLIGFDERSEEFRVFCCGGWRLGIRHDGLKIRLGLSTRPISPRQSRIALHEEVFQKFIAQKKPRLKRGLNFGIGSVTLGGERGRWRG